MNRRRKMIKPSYCYNTNGVNQFYKNDSPTGLNFERTALISIICVIKVFSLNSTADTFLSVRGSDSAARGWSLSGSNAANTLTLGLVSNSGTNNFISAGANVITPGRQQLFIVTIDGSSLATGIKIYTNGKSSSTNPASTLSGTIVSSAPFNIGARNNTDRFANAGVSFAKIISGYVINQDEVLSIWQDYKKYGILNYNIGGTTLAHYDARKGLYDLSGNGNNLAPVNNPLIARI